MRVADWCAGAGGKTLAMAMTMDNRGHIAACDVSDCIGWRRGAAISAGRMHNVERLFFGARRKWAKRRAGRSIACWSMLLAPDRNMAAQSGCPAAPGRTDLARARPKQNEILDLAARLVRNGGNCLRYLLRSVEENEAQVLGFRSGHPDFMQVPFERAWVGRRRRPPELVRCSPYTARHGTDAFFAAFWSERRDHHPPRPTWRCGGDRRGPRGGLAQCISRNPPRGLPGQALGTRQAGYYEAMLRMGEGVLVATASGTDVPAGERPRIVGFATADIPRTTRPRLADGEIHTLYVSDDWRERNGRRLMRMQVCRGRWRPLGLSVGAQR